ncbi:MULTISPECIES: substrate import-associated zinc metallohydrolase lipoprotein [unclassified Sphingobacterium]|uniref:substrate import-associated zinc metallohydrolase lipoprotein n=1 Tax=unclassified Sphingobacterium TaxID=2609468 RepID=UPI0025EA1C0C|nr:MULTISPECIES: substrate import-associated zinc metallohydrolase lipoprotein [unclassified Sphingobacterium]
MKRYFQYIITGCVLVMMTITSCSKDSDKLDVDMNSFNTDPEGNSEVDQWLMSELTDPFNIEVIYRFDRNLTDVSKDIAPVAIDKVKPMMVAVLNLYLKPYQKVAGNKFIKTLAPKQYLLYGSVSYNTNGSVTLGTADGGRKVTLYGVNSFNAATVEGDNGVRRKLRTIHHEFTHILNQNVPIPSDFEAVTKGDYYADWTNSSNTDAVAKSLGFVSRYARGQYTEDFAEMTAHLLVEGQVWFDNYVVSAPISAQQKLRKKEEIVVRYFKDAFDVDFRVLQTEVQNAFKTLYSAKDPADLTQTLANWINTNKVATITYTPGANYLTTYGSSSTFKTLMDNVQAAYVKQNPGYSTGKVTYFQLNFTDATNVAVRLGFTISPTSTTYIAEYYFQMINNPVNGEVQFVKSTNSSGAMANGNGSILLQGFEGYVLPYLTNRIFVAGWLPSGISSTDPLYRTYGGFYEKGVTANYFYGPLTLK